MGTKDGGARVGCGCGGGGRVASATGIRVAVGIRVPVFAVFALRIRIRQQLQMGFEFVNHLCGGIRENEIHKAVAESDGLDVSLVDDAVLIW
jgi:hypothetical protein